MTNAVFTHSPTSQYDDHPEFQYHFPKTYLNQVESALHDWIVFYEPRRVGDSEVGRQAYFAIASVTGIRRDPSTPDHYYALLSGYLDFDTPVPFRVGSHYFESGLRKSDGSTSLGAFRRSVRTIPKQEFETILESGLGKSLESLRTGRDFDSEEPSIEIAERPLVEVISRRRFRDVAFCQSVRESYRNTCAVTGLSLINGGGRPEVQAAHIRPVERDGPDTVRNGLALTGTAHWLFDRGLISATDDFQLLVADRGLPEDARRLFRPDSSIRVPESARARPHQAFLRWHREHVFKG